MKYIYYEFSYLLATDEVYCKRKRQCLMQIDSAIFNAVFFRIIH